ncbi:MAG: GntR family transcriptional regulator [Alkaliphilus sp.]
MENIKQTLVDKVCENIRIDIIKQDLKPGDKIDIKSLSDKYGVSATPLKMALNRLVSENIIQNFPRQGMYIKTIKPEEINEIFEVRQMMDLYYARDIIGATAQH